MRKFYSTFGIAISLSASILVCACSDKKNDVAGGITDIDHSMAYTGKILDANGKGVASARVVAYIDNSISVEDSVETTSDSTGNYELIFDRNTDADTVILYAEYNALCALINAAGLENNDLQISERKMLTGRIDGANDGYVRIKGTSIKAEISEDGTFSINNAPVGEILLQYVENKAPVAVFLVSTAGTSDTIALPPLTEKYLPMEGAETVFDNDSTLATSVNYVDGISGKAIQLEPGQFIEIDSLDPTDGDFTISLWTKWDGSNGNHQILVAQRSYWSDSTSKFQWHFENTEGKFSVMKSAPVSPEEISFGDSSIVPVGKWTFLTLVSKDHQVSMFVNGEQVGKTNTFVPNTLNQAVPFRVGGNEISTETWNGLIDEVRIESVARSKEWILNTFQTHFNTLE